MTAAQQAGAGTQGAARRLLWWMVVPVLALLAVLTFVQYRQRMADSERELQRRADEHAQELEAIARPAMAHVHDLRRLLELNWDTPPDSGPVLRNALSPRPLPPPAAAGAVDGWSLDGAPESLRAQYGQVWWAPVDARPPDPLWLRRAEMFLRAARVVHERAPGFEATWFVAGDENLNFGYPWVDTGRMLAAMGLPTLQAVDKPRAESVVRSKADLARDPKDITFWGIPYVSQLDGELVQSHGAVVQVAGRYVGEVSLDFRLEALQRIARNWQEPGTRVWVADTALRLLADATEALRPPPGQGLADTQVAVPLAQRLPWKPSADELTALKAPKGSLLHGDNWVVVTAGRPGSPWLYVQAVPQQVLRAQVLPTLLPNALLGLTLLLVFVAGQWLFARWFVTPALRVLGYLRARSTDPQAAVPQLGERWMSWVHAVTDTFETQRLLQQRERASEAFKSAMVDHAPLAIVTSDGQGCIVDFNPAAEGLFGVPRADALGQQLGALILPDAVRDGPRRLSSGVHTARHRSGREFPMQMLSFRVQIEGEPFDTAFISDLSAQQDAAAQIDRQRDALRQSEKLSAMGTLLAGVAHELNNPLAIVMGRASLLEEKALAAPMGAGAEAGAVQDDARRIREAAERCGRIVRTFLNMARQRPPSRSAVQVNDTVRAAADMLGYTLRSHGIKVDLQLAESMPDVQADADQLGQVVLNLVVNAQQAMESVQGARVLTLSTGVEAPRPGGSGGSGREPRVWLRVADTGTGVPAAARDRLFEPFFTTKAAGFGTGLGLSVSRSIVREHGGDLVLEPRYGGAVFRMSLPISGGAAPASVAAPLDTAAGELHERVLVVDDEAEIADLMRAVLEGAGFDVATAESGAVALEMLAEARFDAIVSDVRMPDIDGAALWRAVREQHPALARRMLFVSGDTLSSQARQVLEETRCPSLDKPFARADLLVAVRDVLGR
jgi:PAS domain S-box-containing protein